MRSPGEAPGLIALETAMDELAVELDMDPIELRIRNEPSRDLERDVPFSARNLVRCYHEGAERFGWADRPSKPASRREGRWLIGYGMAAAVRPAKIVAGSASVWIGPDATVRIKADMTDIGTGTYTILAQVAADALKLPMNAVSVELGDSLFPPGLGSGGSWGAATTAHAVHAACTNLREELRKLATGKRDGSLDVAAMARSLGPHGLEVTGEAPTDTTAKTLSKKTFGAHFAEVGVDADTGETRLRRMLGVFDAGRLLNPKLARSQLIGGMTWGLSAALHEEAVLDMRHGQFVNHDLGEYHVPVHADVPEIEAVFLEEPDPDANPLGIKGIGELGICGAAAAVGNAVFNATGLRIRKFPITLDKLLSGLPALEL
jgi:xanthine dehydrogenase YagR molybdenum-binding subunit